MESYEEVLERMSERYKELTGITPGEDSDIGVRLRILAGEIYSTQVNIDWLRRQTNFTTAQGEYLDYHAQQRGIARHEASKSVGNVIFSLSLPAASDVTVPKGTVVSTSDAEPLCFETVEEVIISAGTTAIHADVEAIEAGRRYNVTEGKISSFVTPVALVSSVTNPDPLEGGSDEESDENLRARLADSLKNASCATNCAYYRDAAVSVSGVSSACVVPKARGVGTVDVYIAAQGAEVSDETLVTVQEKLSKEREVNVDVLVKKASPAQVNYYLQIELASGYEFEAVKARCLQALNDFVAEARVGGTLTLTKAGERIIHTEGVEDYSFKNYTNRDIYLEPSQFAVAGSFVIAEGI